MNMFRINLKLKRKKPTIGSIERVSLPSHGVHDALAKIDSGADSSAIWASAIKEKDGTLSFKLFGPTSHHYTGEVITTEHYTRVKITNSFGDVERRFKVQLTLHLGGKRIRANFNLANRSRSRYPILIGNTAIRHKFLIDVSTKVEH